MFKAGDVVKLSVNSVRGGRSNQLRWKGVVVCVDNSPRTLRVHEKILYHVIWSHLHDHCLYYGEELVKDSERHLERIT
jgi:hypothetical protein